MSRFTPKYVAKELRIALILCLLITLTAAVSFPFIQPVIPIFYSLTQPEKQLMPKYLIFFYPVFAWVVFFINSLLIKFFTQVESNMHEMFAWTTTGIIAIAGILIIRTITIIT